MIYINIYGNKIGIKYNLWINQPDNFFCKELFSNSYLLHLRERGDLLYSFQPKHMA